MPTSRLPSWLLLLGCGVSLSVAAPSSQAPATGLIVGQVVDGSTGRPLAGAIVSIAGTQSAAGRPQILTRADGRFVYPDLAPGAYTISATRQGYTDGSLGRTRPGGPSRAMQLAAGERVGDAIVAMWRNAAIGGTIVDESGERQVAAVVKAFRRTIVAGQRQFQQVASTRSDDRGVFRFGNLMPGHYVVGSVPRYTSVPDGTAGDVRQMVGGSPALRARGGLVVVDRGVMMPPPAGETLHIYPPTYHPFSPVIDGATVVTLAPGQEYENADLRLSPVAAVPVSGFMTGPDGPLPRSGVQLVPEGAGALSLESDWLVAAPDRAGRFVFPAVPAGQYVARVRQPQVRPTGPGSQERDVLWADVPVTIGKEPVENLTIVAQTGLRIRGQVELDGTRDRTAALSRLSITIEPADPQETASGAGSSSVQADAFGQFASTGLPGGRYYVRVANSPSGWMFVGATLDGRDVTDAPLSISSDTSGVSVRFTDRWSGINGSVAGARGPDPSALVVVFPADSSLWGASGANPRRTRSAATNAAGGFSITLPPGDYYAAAVRDDIGEDWRDPEVLATISRSATRLSIRDGEHRTLQMKTVVIRTIVPLMAVAATLAAAAQQPRDAVRVRPAGTAAIHGVVNSKDAEPLPLRRARVTVDGVDVDYSATAITADDGTFAFENLPAGSYTVRGSKEPFVAAAAGARRPGGAGTPITITAGQRREVRLQLARGGVITGRVHTPDGEAAAGINVMALTNRYIPAEGERRLAQIPSTTVVTDDRGEYRIYGLPPGDYLVSAVPTRGTSAGLQVLTDAEVREALAAVSRTLWSPGRPGSTGPPPRPAAITSPPARPMALAQVYHPATPFLDRATVVRLDEGTVRRAVDIDLTLLPLANVEGSVAVPGGSERVQLTMIRDADAETSERPRGTATDAGGQFGFRAVPPGRYRILARSSTHFGSADLVVGGEDIAGLSIVMQPPLTVSGRLVFDPPPESMPELPRLRLLQLIATGAAVAPPPQASISGDTFTVSGLIPSRYRLASAPQGIRAPVGRWWLKSAIVGGREILDEPLEFQASHGDAVLRWSDRFSELSGEVRDSAGGPARSAWVIVFARDPRSWFFHSRRVAGVRPGADGRFTVRNLPPGEYLVAATSQVEMNEWFDPEVLAALIPQATPVAIAEDGRHTLDLILR